jgi:hypothetical protein
MDMFSVNVALVACMCAAFRALLAKSPAPKVINIRSGLASITNTLAQRMNRAVPYRTSKVALNELVAHLQAVERDRMALAKGNGDVADSAEIRFYVAAPGLLKTALTGFH